MHQELCFACYAADNQSAEMWMCNNVKNPQWERRYTIGFSGFRSQCLYPIAAFDGEILFKDWFYYTRLYHLTTKAYKDVDMMKLRYHDPRTDTLGYGCRTFTFIDIIRYVPSLIPI